MLSLPILLLSIAAAAPPLATGPLTVTSTAMVEARTRAADGSTTVALTPARRVVPGDRLTFVVAFRNDGPAALSNVVIANPVPATVRFRGAAAGTPEPEVSADGTSFAPLASLRVAGPNGLRAATADDVTHVRWRLDRALTGGARGQFAFQAVLK